MHLTILALTFLLGIATGTNYEGYKLYKVEAKTEADNQFLLNLESNNNHFDFWSDINKIEHPVEVMVAPQAQPVFEDRLGASGIPFEILIEDVQSILDSEKQHRLSLEPIQAGRMSFDNYLRHSEINTYLNQLAVNYTTVTLVNIGKSYEGRNLDLIRISSGGQSKPVIFIDAGIHAREWIAPAVALYLINQLVEVPENSDLIAEVDWIILPVLNPDGYEYTHTTDRLWRKTRSEGIQCDGADANRNFGHHWLEAGASAWECSDIYAGSQPFSEPEGANLRDYIRSTANVVTYLSVHSYGQLLLYPWGYSNISCDNSAQLDEVGKRVNDAIAAVRGTTYTVGHSTKVLYAAAGNSVDWAMGVAGIDIAFTIELPAGRGTASGFIVLPTDIRPIVEETFQGFKAFHQYVVENSLRN